MKGSEERLERCLLLPRIEFERVMARLAAPDGPGSSNVKLVPRLSGGYLSLHQWLRNLHWASSRYHALSFFDDAVTRRQSGTRRRGLALLIIGHDLLLSS